MLAAAGRANNRLSQISDQLTELVTATSAWDRMDLSRQRAIIKNLMTITLHTQAEAPAATSTPRRPFEWLRSGRIRSCAR